MGDEPATSVASRVKFGVNLLEMRRDDSDDAAAFEANIANELRS